MPVDDSLIQIASDRAMHLAGALLVLVCLIVTSSKFLRSSQRKLNADDADRLSVESPLIFTDLFEQHLSAQFRRYQRPVYLASMLARSRKRNADNADRLSVESLLIFTGFYICVYQRIIGVICELLVLSQQRQVHRAWRCRPHYLWFGLR